MVSRPKPTAHDYATHEIASATISHNALPSKANGSRLVEAIG